MNMILSIFGKTSEIGKINVHCFLGCLLSVTYINSLLHILSVFLEFAFVDTLAVELRQK